MTILRAFTCLTLICGASWAQYTDSIWNQPIEWLPEIVRIQSALDVLDPSKDDLQAYREALQDACFSENPEVQEQVRLYLLKYWRWVPPDAFEDIIQSWGRRSPEKAAVSTALLDSPRWREMPREDRKAAYSRCLVGQKDSPRSRMTASLFVCVGGATLEGFLDLMPLIESAYQRLSPGEQQAAPLRFLKLEASLCNGAPNRAQALKLKTQAIREVPTDVLYARAMEDRAWAILLTKVATDACGGRLGNSECSTMRNVVDELWHEWKRSSESVTTESTRPMRKLLGRLRDETEPARRFDEAKRWHAKGRPITPFGTIDVLAYAAQRKARRQKRQETSPH